MKVILLVICTLVAIGVIYGSYVYGVSRGKKVGYTQAYTELDETIVSQAKYDELENKHNLIIELFNGLVDDYNSLRSDTINYVNATRYQPRQSLSCTSHNYGLNNSYTSTYCY